MIRKYKINATKDVENFLHYLVSPQGLNLGMSFHPDDTFEDYINSKGERVFSKEEAAMLNQKMAECFNVCERNQADIYEIAYKYATAA